MLRQDEPASGAHAKKFADLIDLDHAGWAWEWLRRSPRYRTDVAPMHPGQRQIGSLISVNSAAADRAAFWGLHFRRRSRRSGMLGASALAS